MKKQVVLIEGGTRFDSYNEYTQYLKTMPISLEYLNKQTWRDNLQTNLGDDFEVVRLKMPNRMNARYQEWKIYFERYLAILDENLILIGHSLGAVFLVKFLMENKTNKTINKLILIAAPFGANNNNIALGDFAFKEKDLSSNNVVLFASDNDKLIPYEDADKYNSLINNLKVVSIPGREHFSQKHFPELMDEIKNEIT